MFLEPDPEKPKASPEEVRAKTLPDEVLRTERGHQNIEDIDPESMEGEKYNMCHFWSNFEIARLDWFRSKEYNDFFDMMDRSGGFWVERVSIPNRSCCTLLTEPALVGRCAHPFSRRWSTSGSPRYSLLPRFWLQAYNHTALPSKCTRTAAPQDPVSREDNRRRKATRGRRRVLGNSRHAERERRGVSLQM
jgi:Glycolipid 2-alpha-mannosyltransferase